MRWPRSLMLPEPEADPKEILRSVRRLEVVSGIAALLLALIPWNEGWWRWVLLGVGVFALSPWPGPAAILRRAERKPEILVTDPDRRRVRGRRIAMALVPLYSLTGAVVGYLVDGWPAAIFMGTLMGAGAALGAWSYVRRTKT